MNLFENAMEYALHQHAGQVRKTSSIPYILHPMEVATIVASMTDNQEVLAAAVLHDTVEDANATLEEIAEKFGKRVSLLVMTETEEKRADRPPEETWKLRKEETLTILTSTSDIGVLMLWMGDKLANMRSFYRLYRAEGDAMWQRFNQKDPAMQAWYYRTIADCLSPLSEFDAYKEFVTLVNTVFENYKEVRHGL